MKIDTILKILKTNFKSLCKKINKYGSLNYHIRNGADIAFSGKNAEYRKASFLLMLSASEIKLPVKIIDYLISDKVHNETYSHLSCDYNVRVALASRTDLRQRHIDLLKNCYNSNGAYVLRKLALNKSIPEKILRDNLFKWFDYDGCGAYHGSAASLAISRINFTEDEIRKIYLEYKKLTKNDIESVIILLIHSPNTPKDLFVEFCKTNEFHAKVALANDNRTPIAVLENYTKENDSWVSESARKTLANI